MSSILRNSSRLVNVAKRGVRWSVLCGQYRKYQMVNSRTMSETNVQPTSDQEGLQLSDTCVKQLKKLNKGDDTFLRVVVEGGGCSGFQYKFELDTDINEAEDRVFERDGVCVVVDQDSVEFLSGSTVDYHEELIRSAFRIINNPKAEQGCSCGASFSLKL